MDNQDRPKASNRRNIWRSGAETEELAAGPSLLLQESLQSQPLLEGWAIARTSFQEIFLCAVRSPGKSYLLYERTGKRAVNFWADQPRLSARDRMIGTDRSEA